MDEKIVYIIIVVIWIVSSLIKAFNKKNKPQSPQKTPQQEKRKTPEELDDFKKILEEIITGKQPMAKKEQVDEYVEKEPTGYTYETAPTTSKYAAFEGATDYNFNQYASLEDTFEKDSNRIVQMVEDKAYATNHNDDIISKVKILNEDFDIKKAVIYSEILKRPQY